MSAASRSLISRSVAVSDSKRISFRIVKSRRTAGARRAALGQRHSSSRGRAGRDRRAAIKVPCVEWSGGWRRRNNAHAPWRSRVLLRLCLRLAPRVGDRLDPSPVRLPPRCGVFRRHRDRRMPAFGQFIHSSYDWGDPKLLVLKRAAKHTEWLMLAVLAQTFLLVAFLRWLSEGGVALARPRGPRVPRSRRALGGL